MDTFSPEDKLDEIWEQGKAFGLMDSEIYQVLTAAVEERGRRPPQVSRWKDHDKYLSRLLTIVKVLIVVVSFLIVTLIVGGLIISTHNPTRKFVTRNIQDLIYPVMSRLRRASLPFLAKYPTMSSWYSEECLIENPFFDHVSMDCGSCSKNSQINIVSEVENFTEAYYNKGNIVVMNGITDGVSWTKLLSKLNISKEENLGAWKIRGSSSDDYSSISEKLGDRNGGALHIEWKINRLETLHILRQLLPRFHFIPRETEISLHHMVFIDGQDCKAYPLPISEFANVILVQGEGSSMFTLEPSPHCEHNCQSVAVTLNASQVLFFNWVYWRPVRLGGEGISTLILSSFY